MITKEQLIEELETIDDVQILEQVHQLIQQLKQPKKMALMSQLRSVQKITAPIDFSANIDAYLNRGKTMENNYAS